MTEHETPTGAGRRDARAPPGPGTRFCDLAGVRYPIVQTGMGWVAGPRLVAATAAAGGLGVLASATMTLDQMADAFEGDRVAHRRPVRGQPAHRRGRRRATGWPS